MSAIDKIREMKAAYTAKIEAEGKDALREEFAAFFAANPNVTAIRWRQYTPHFNDGDPCVFRLGEFYIKDSTVPIADDDGDYEDGFGYVEGPTGDALSTFEHAVSEKDVFLSVFGDHVRVTATPSGFEVSEYSHD